MFYLELKKREPDLDFTRYPLYLTYEINNIRHAFASIRSETTKDHLFIEAVQLKCVASNSLHEQEGEVLVDMVVDYIDNAEHISGQILDIF